MTKGHFCLFFSNPCPEPVPNSNRWYMCFAFFGIGVSGPFQIAEPFQIALCWIVCIFQKLGFGVFSELQYLVYVFALCFQYVFIVLPELASRCMFLAFVAMCVFGPVQVALFGTCLCILQTGCFGGVSNSISWYMFVQFSGMVF